MNLDYQKMQLDVDRSPPANIMTHVSIYLDPVDPWPLTLPLSQVTFSLTLTLVTFDLDPCDLWPWPRWPSILLVSLSNEASNDVFWSSDLDLWPMTLKIRVDLGVIHVHDLAKCHDPRCNGSWDINFGLVTDRHTESSPIPNWLDF